MRLIYTTGTDHCFLLVIAVNGKTGRGIEYGTVIYCSK